MALGARPNQVPQYKMLDPFDIPHFRPSQAPSDKLTPYKKIFLGGKVPQDQAISLITPLKTKMGANFVYKKLPYFRLILIDYKVTVDFGNK